MGFNPANVIILRISAISYKFVQAIIYMGKLESLQIGHSLDKAQEFKVEYEVVNNSNVEVPFSHRHFFYAVYWMHEGDGTHVIDFEEYEIRPDRVFFIKPEQVHFLHGRAHLKYSALQFTEDFMMPYLFAGQKDIAVYKDLSQAEAERIEVLFKQLQTESVSNLPNSNSVIQSEINTLLLELERMSIPAPNTSVIPDILRKYKDLIDKDFVKERQVRNYAERLGISPNYLNVLARKHLGKSALEMINERVVLEVKRMLIRTEYDISEIAYKLGFNELSYFSRFFKRQTGMTPLRFRISMNEMYQR